MARGTLIEELYHQLNSLIRRSRELGNDLHPGLSLVGYTCLDLVETVPEIRASDLADRLSLDKSTVSRQLNQLFDAGLLDRKGGRPGRRGDPLSDAGRPARPGGRCQAHPYPVDVLVRGLGRSGRRTPGQPDGPLQRIGGRDDGVLTWLSRWWFSFGTMTPMTPGQRGALSGGLRLHLDLRAGDMKGRSVTACQMSSLANVRTDIVDIEVVFPCGAPVE